MSFERDVNVAVGLMFKHTKSVVTRNITQAVTRGELTIDVSRLPGLDLIISKSIDDAFKQSSKQLADVLKQHEAEKKLG